MNLDDLMAEFDKQLLSDLEESTSREDFCERTSNRVRALLNQTMGEVTSAMRQVIERYDGQEFKFNESGLGLEQQSR